MTRANAIDSTLHYVDPDPKLGYAIGKFVVAWGDLEQQLDVGFHVLFHTDPTLAVCLFANLGTRAKVDALQSAIALQEKPIGKSRAARARKVLARIGELSDRARLTTAHGQVQLFHLDEKGSGRWELLRQIARTKPKLTIYPANARYWNARAKDARALAAHWRYYVADIHSKIGPLTLQDLREICGIETQFARSPSSGRRKPRPQRRHALEGRLTTRPKWPRI